MASKPKPSPYGKSGPGGMTDTVSVKSNSTTTTTKAPKDPMKTLWCQTQWTNLSHQAIKLGISTIPYFDPETMLLSKEVNEKLWKRMGRLYDHLGSKQASYAVPVMVDHGEVKWYSYIDGAKGDEAEIYDP